MCSCRHPQRPARSPGTPRVTVCVEVNFSATVNRAKIYIDTLPVWNSALQGREGSIPDRLYIKCFIADGDRVPPPGLKKMATRRPAAKADYRPGPSVASKETAGRAV
jgi:hypothetical protein